ncbi:hypothetical protein [Agrococcus sp. ARC_14]|uniref:hypothetical protein n=1 Tax=Agrococcus sp. ARC_14 TaxID=2919927 RepID=UPI001F057E0D|nr:hypothetical protein [Agrococcus sp. ARC_14]MCH1881626.1 hypothetical protein [Agrococcus sp. ARC_14]
MYAAIWRALPGPWPLRLVLALALVAGVAYLLIFHVYPWVMQEFFPTPDPVLDASGRASISGLT